MTQREAHDIITLIADQWRRPIVVSAPIWISMLLNYEYDLGVKTVAYLAQRSKFCPSMAEFQEVLNMLREKRRPAIPATTTSSVQATGTLPDWINIWGWMRLHLNDFRALPQQAAVVDGAISAEEYDELQQQWRAAGSPQVSGEQLMAAMKVNTKAKQ